MNARLLDTRYDSLASNTIDYWMLPDDPTMTLPTGGNIDCQRTGDG